MTEPSLKLLSAPCPVCHHSVAASFFDGGAQPLATLGWPDSAAKAMAWAAAALDRPVWLFAETPCIDRVFTTGRLADFYYEHPSQFTTASFRTLMQRGGKVEELDHGYDGEVVFALVQLGIDTAWQTGALAANTFACSANASRQRIRQQLDELAASGQRVAIWGGTGKAAAFIHQFGADAKRFPLVVDSDPDKAGSCVPGTGQVIMFRDALTSVPVDVVIIPTQWRAHDIVVEMDQAGIAPRQILIEHAGNLIDFHHASHPYR